MMRTQGHTPQTLLPMMAVPHCMVSCQVEPLGAMAEGWGGHMSLLWAGDLMQTLHIWLKVSSMCLSCFHSNVVTPHCHSHEACQLHRSSCAHTTAQNNQALCADPWLWHVHPDWHPNSLRQECSRHHTLLQQSANVEARGNKAPWTIIRAFPSSWMVGAGSGHYACNPTICSLCGEW